MKLLCPNCAEQIAAEDVNMKEDLVLCRKCNEAYTIEECRQDTQEFSRDILLNPPRGCYLNEGYDGTQITISQSCWPALIFFLPFTCVWAGGSMWGLYGTQILSGKFDLFRSLFGLPFLAGSIALVSACLYMMFGKVRIFLDSYTLKMFNGVGFIGVRKQIDWSRVEGVVVQDSRMQSNNKQYRQVVLKGKFDNGKSEIKLLSSTKDEKLDFIRSALLSRKKNTGTRH